MIDAHRPPALRARRRMALGLQAALWMVALLAAPAADASHPPAAREERTVAGRAEELDAIVRWGDDQPVAALARLQILRPAVDGSPDERPWRLAVGLIEARYAKEAPAQASARWLADFAHRHGDAMAQADALLVQAVLAETLGRRTDAGEHAQQAADLYDRLCGPRVAQPHPGCDQRNRWRAHQLLASSAGARGLLIEQRRHWEMALEIARRHRDPYREVRSLVQLAMTLANDGEVEPATRLLGQGERVAHHEASGDLLARVRQGQAWVAHARGDDAASRRLLLEAHRLARQAGARRMEALILGNLSDDLVRAQRPREALGAVEQALPIVRELRDRRLERTLLHNASLARLGLKQVAQARRDFDQLLTLWEEGGEGDLTVVLREFSDALAAAGDPAGALELYHRERKLASDVMARNRESALRDLQVRYDREVQQRHIDLLERDNAIKTAQIANRELLQRVWTLLAATLAAAAAFAVLLYLRVRETQKQLERSQAHLRVQSERDPLTGLANRRSFQAAMQQRGALQSFEGALLLLDIDHFKHVNDVHGHAVGDEVLVEVGQRVQEAVRSDDLVVRWGGEEFLVFAPGLEGDALKALAERLLLTVGEEAVSCQGQTLRVTASIGHAHFPLPPQRLALSWERALNFVDMALYTAKSLGRNRAVGITTVQAADLGTLREVEDDFETAWTQGQVTVTVSEGPAA